MEKSHMVNAYRDNHCMPIGLACNKYKTIPTFGSCWPFHNPFHHIADVAPFGSAMIRIWWLLQFKSHWILHGELRDCDNCPKKTITKYKQLSHSLSWISFGIRTNTKRKTCENYSKTIENSHCENACAICRRILIQKIVVVLKSSNHIRCHMHFCLFEAKLLNANRTIDWCSR